MNTHADKSLRKAKVTDDHKYEAARLTELWETRLHETQGIFGEKYEIGGQSAVGQFLRGEVPLSLKAARGFAKGLQCQIKDFSPRLAKQAADLGLVSGADDAIDLTRLDRVELQLVQLYRSLHADQKHDLLLHANHQYTLNNPQPSSANPFGGKKPPREN